MENQKLDRYVGDYDRFMEVYEMKKSQLEAAYNRQQAEIAKLRTLLREIRPAWRRETWLCHGRRRWIRWM